MASLLIDNALQEIAKEYRPGLLVWLKRQPDRWRQLLTLEDRINQTALSKDDPGLKTMLQAYKDFFQEMLERNEMNNALPIFGRRMP